ncbi:unnamed protein product [Cuscuta epithymum]|uniref:SURP motif domain-containing protein n=1 Tax=Cuscuta epithymum TaxID=186058 RepID=A0AAV0BXJ0_9ASTE|nr:unnamed protein product [Cuscuta epithymum]
MPDHHLHPYYRFLVDHQELLHSNGDMKPQTGERKVVNEPDGALSLLGSVYGSGEDEDVSNKTTSDEAVDAVPNAQKEQFSALLPKQDESVLKHPFHSGGLDNEKTHILKKNPLVGGFNGGSTSHKKPKDDHVSVSVHAALEKLKASGLGITLKTEPVALEPPSDLKKLIGKIVEFIRKNGKQFEATLIEQDNKHCRFPFLLPSNMYHPYYLKVLHGSQETKYSGNSLQSGSDGSLGKRPEERASLSLVSGDGDLPYENDKKEKFKMVIGKSKKESQEQLDKAPQQENGGFSVDAASAAAILQAAARGIKNPNIAIFSKTAENAETSAEADSCDPQLSKEQQLKAERLKKAKMFVAMLKNRSVPSLKGEPSRAVSSEPHYSGQLDGNRSDQGEGLKFIDEYSAKRSMRKYRSNASRHEEDEEDEGETEHQSLGSDHKSLRHMPDDDKGEKSEDRKEHRRSKRKKHHQSHHSDEDSDVSDRYEEERRSRRHSRKNHRSHNKRDDDDDEIDEEKHHRHSRKKHKSHNSSKNTSRHERSKRASHCDDEHHRNKSDKLRKGAADGEDLEEGEISKVSDQSTRGLVCREASNDVSSPPRSTSQPSDELRAKIRAMLMEARR